ncbi:MAG: hypothetical protein HYZ57_07945 [Acidobacteria bacterium]|nr:hypothetical protein [Acidobacteriota bacterium]MBI3279755.1 hypothetical protein [Acidobacteriota bacterium]
MSLKLYLITCDLRFSGGGYDSLKERLRTLGAVQVLDDQWAMRSKESAAHLRDELRSFLDDRDGIVVVEVGEERASRRARRNLAEL